MAGELNVDLKKLGKDLARAGRKKSQALAVELASWVRKDLFAWEAAMKQRLSGPLVLFPEKKSRGQLLHSRSGEGQGIRGSFVTRIENAEKGLQGMRAIKGTTSLRALVHELGTKGENPESTIEDIRPRRVRFLTIPMPAALYPSGIPRETKASDWEGTFIWASPDDPRRRYIARRSDDGELELLYALHPGPVKIPPRLGMVKVHNRRANRRATELRKHVDKALAS